MSYTLAVRTALRSDTVAAARAALMRLTRVLLVVGGAVAMLLGLALTLLPSHLLGLPFLIGGLMMVLRNSMMARKEFIKYQRRHPNVVFPVRRLLRRDPEVAPVVWQQMLRSERMVLPRKWRFARRMRRRLMRRTRS